MKKYSKVAGIMLLLLFALLFACKEEEIKVILQNKLVAAAGVDQNVKIKTELTLDGSASYDGNGKSFTYQWSIKEKPQGSTAQLIDANKVNATFTPDAIGVYVIQLKISQDNWTSSDELQIVATSADPDTPTAVVINENILNDTTLPDIFEDPAKPDYVITKDIEVRANLVINPGVVLAFEENRSFQIINGSIRALGNADKNIFFKGVVDDAAYWKGIVIHTNSDLNEFEYVIVTHAGSNPLDESGIKANVLLAGTQVSGAALKISHTVFSESGGYGLYMQGMSLLNRFSNNAFINNTIASAYIPANQLHKIDVVSFTGTPGLETGGTIHANEVTWKKLVGSYTVTNDIHINGGGVTIEPGTSFKMKSGVTVSTGGNGYLKAIGSDALKVSFNSTANNVYWNGLHFNSFHENNILKHCEVSHAGLNRIADAAHPANIAVGVQGKVSIENSVIKNSLGYGLITATLNNINSNFSQVNQFSNLQSGIIFPALVDIPEKPSIEGTWLDISSFMDGESFIADNFYNKDTGVWFEGAANPWAINSGGFGMYIDEAGNFTWIIAERHPVIGCESYSAEYITGTATIFSDRISFDQNYFRSKFINSCDVTQNVDTEVTPFEVLLRYDISRIFNPNTGGQLWELKFYNPDNSTFSYYRR